MTGIAIVDAQAVRVAHLAIAEPALPVIKGEGVREVKQRWHPGSRIVTGKAVAAKQSQVISWLCVTGRTLLRRATEDAAGMAIGTGHSLVRTR